MPLLVHGEVTDPQIDVFDREAVFIDRVLDPLRRRLPELRIVLEHITTEEAAQYVAASGANLAATITAHHLVINRNAIFAGGIRPHLYCLPIAKREKHRLALRRAAVVGRSALFPRHRQRPACGPDQGDGLRLRRHLHRPLRAGNLCRGVRRRRRARPARSLRLTERPAILPAAAQRNPRDAQARAISGSGAHRRRRERRRAVPRRRNLALAPRCSKHTVGFPRPRGRA